ncbi:MAG: glycosyltransferase family 4 protein, partial [Patescibacteria group bacterium]
YWSRVDRLVTVSEEDATVIKKMIPGIKIDIVPNGVGEDFTNLPRKIHYNHTLYYMGDYKWIQNWEAVDLLANKVFPLVKKDIPDAKLIIAGKFPTPEVLSLASRDIEVLEFKGNDGSSVVSACMKSGLFVAPMYAPGGTRLKILASMAAMMPVVTTPIGAEGYGAVDGKSILIGDRPEDLAAQSVRVLKDKLLYNTIAENARKLVDTKFTWEPIAKKLESIYEELIHHHS